MGKFRIPHIPPTTPKTVRFPNDMVEEIEKLIQGQECTFSAFVLEAVKEAIVSLKEEKAK